MKAAKAVQIHEAFDLLSLDFRPRGDARSESLPYPEPTCLRCSGDRPHAEIRREWCSRALASAWHTDARMLGCTHNQTKTWAAGESARVKQSSRASSRRRCATR